MSRERIGSLYKKSRRIDGKRVKSKCWYGSFVDPHTGKRTTKKLYSDKAASRRELDRMVEDAEKKAVGIIDRYAEHRTRPLAEHVSDYMDHCKHVGQSERHRHVKKVDLERLIDGINAKRLTDLEPTRVERHMHSLRDEDLSARKINAVRSHVLAFMNWCVKTGRCPDNPLTIVPKLDERKDRRRVRRALSEDELIRLLDAAEKRPGRELRMIRRGKNKGKLLAKVKPASAARARQTGRERRLIYLIAALTGLRRGELRKITWGDVELETATLRVRIGVGKAKREDFIPLHPQAIDELTAFKPADTKSTDRVFSALPTCRTFELDLERAREIWIDEAGDDKQEREQREKSDFLAKHDHQGRVVDLHAMRTTLGTKLARHGVAPQLAQRIMRHSDYKTTLGHYTVLGLTDTARAVESLPRIELTDAETPANVAGATGTDDASPTYGEKVVAPVVADGVHSGSFRVTSGQFARHETSPSRRHAKEAQPADISTNNPPRQGVSRGGRKERATGIEPATFSLEGQTPSVASFYHVASYDTSPGRWYESLHEAAAGTVWTSRRTGQPYISFLIF